MTAALLHRGALSTARQHNVSITSSNINSRISSNSSNGIVTVKGDCERRVRLKSRLFAKCMCTCVPACTMQMTLCVTCVEFVCVCVYNAYDLPICV
jgi:hypothetical protein